MMKGNPYMKRGQIYYADLDPVRGSEQGGMRPVLIIQNDLGNRFSPTVIVLPLTSRTNKAPLRTHVTVHPPMGGLQKSSVILCEQVRTLEKKRLLGYVGMLRPDKMRQVEQALLIAVGGIDKGDTPPYNKEETLSEERTETDEGTVEE
jgi:mRNA interferase MazF